MNVDGNRATTPAGAIVDALWSTHTIAIGPNIDETSWTGPGQIHTERELLNRIRRGDRCDVVIVEHLTPAILRTLREHPCALVVWTGDAGSEDVLAIEHGFLRHQTWLLGPRARMHVGSLEDDVVVVAHREPELIGLRRALSGERTLALALSPTPKWLHELLDEPRMRPIPVAGTIAAPSLSTHWVDWAQRHITQVLVPVGIDPPRVDTDSDAVLAAAVGAQALERRTGPVFPAPRVINLVLSGLLDPSPRPTTDGDLAMWKQARRALPIVGVSVGMDTPLPTLSLASPTSAFLAQRALLRVASTDALDPTDAQLKVDFEDDGTARAEEVLRNAGDVLTDHESKVVLRGYGLEVTRQAVANSASGASGFADRIGYPVVLKAVSPDLRRRSDIGGVLLDLETAAAVRRGYASIVENIEHRAPTARLDGVLVAERIPTGVDIRCGVRRLEEGDVVIYGHVEGDHGPVEVALSLLPLQPRTALEFAHAILMRTPVPALRRDSDPDLPRLAATLLRLSTLVDDMGERIHSITLGPMRWVGPERGYVTLDACIVQQPHLQGL